MDKMSPAKAIKVFFEADGGRKLGFDEMKALTGEERRELALLCAKELGVEIEIPQA